jgi:hypothetical protein
MVIWKMDLEVLKRNGKHKTWGKSTTSNIVMQNKPLASKFYCCRLQQITVTERWKCILRRKYSAGL